MTDGGTRSVRAPRGTEVSCKGWVQEAALRMIMNNLDSEVAEQPNDLIVYGGTGKLHGVGRRSMRSFVVSSPLKPMRRF